MVRGVYHKHRASQEEGILAAAEKLFVAMGIENVKMADIAAEAGVTKPTLYKYFAGKEDVAVRIFQKIAEGWARENREHVWTGEGTGWERVELFVLHRFIHGLENLEEMSFWAEFEMLYARCWPVEKGLSIFREHLEYDKIKLAEAICEGQADGSVRTDRTPYELLAAVFNFNSSLFLRLGLFKGKMAQEYVLSLEEIHLTLCRVFLDGLRPAD